MAHFAELNENNIVQRVLVTDNDFPGEGYEWLMETFGGRWVQTSYNATIRKNFAAVGCVYDEVLDAFIAPKPFESWVLNEATCIWEPPVERPEGEFVWDEESISWKEVI